MGQMISAREIVSVNYNFQKFLWGMDDEHKLTCFQILENVTVTLRAYYNGTMKYYNVKSCAQETSTSGLECLVYLLSFWTLLQNLQETWMYNVHCTTCGIAQFCMYNYAEYHVGLDVMKIKIRYNTMIVWAYKLNLIYSIVFIEWNWPSS